VATVQYKLCNLIRKAEGEWTAIYGRSPRTRRRVQNIPEEIATFKKNKYTINRRSLCAEQNREGSQRLVDGVIIGYE
jgi:hypothetical protein